MPAQQEQALQTLFEYTATYVDTNLELAKLKAIKKGTKVGASLATKIIVGSIFLVAIMLLNIGISIWLGSILGKIYYGFFILAFVYILIGSLLYLYRYQWLQTPMVNSMIKYLNN